MTTKFKQPVTDSKFEDAKYVARELDARSSMLRRLEFNLSLKRQRVHGYRDRERLESKHVRSVVL